MREPERHETTPRPVRQPVLLGLFAGTAVGAGYLLVGIPNVELMTLVVALSGAVLGGRSGAACGALAAATYSLLSPYGLPAPLLLAGQMIAGAVTGTLGWALTRGRRIGPVRAVVLGLVATLSFDVLTNAAIMAMLDLEPWVVAVQALPLAGLHLAANAVIFALLFPLLQGRLLRLAGPGLVGTARAGILAVLCLVPAKALTAPLPDAPVAADTVAADTVAADTLAVALPEQPAGPHGWRRPLWRPFSATFGDWARTETPLVVVADGGVASQTRVLGEAGGSPLVVRDGVPLGTGHILADDPWLVPVEGLEPVLTSRGADGWGGMDGRIDLTTLDAEPEGAVSRYRGTKGRHESYYRGVSLLTPRAGWRAAFAFDEALDNEGYNHTDEPDFVYAGRRSDGFTGQGKVRHSRIRLTRTVTAQDEVWVEFDRGRRTKDDLPALGAGWLEAWDQGVAVGARGAAGAVALDSRVFWRSRDLMWGDRYTGDTPPEDARRLETSRAGVRLDAAARADSAGGGWRLGALVTEWRVLDDGGAYDPIRGEGTAGSAGGGLGGRLGSVPWRAAAAWDWDSHAGGAPRASLSWGPEGRRPSWRLDLDAGGRAPRSDELLTPLHHDVAGRELLLLPNPGLAREKTLRAALRARRRVLGLDLAVDLSVRRVADGIEWNPSAADPDVGTWENGREMDAARATASVAREGSFLGWGRVLLEGTWRRFDVSEGTGAGLPPDRSLRLHVMWENHFFAEDGILQAALQTTVLGERTDPWDVSGATVLPATTVHDLLLGFRLVGAHLGFNLRNLTGERHPLTAGAYGPGQETEMRLSWDFRH